MRTRDLHYIDGIGCDPNGRWAGEPSFLVLGIVFDQAKALGDQYQQNAILWASEDAVPRLVTLR
ncbi:DUF3293 domain-containing protein [Sphingomonas sp. RB1R13]|uniref:DUF3293 domain-containing protein n=1 Tax=Sphingomonas sp. RB1R13 TaxID=3096159 RepID=UPI003FA6D575